MSKSMLSVVVFAIVASAASAQFMEPLLKTATQGDHRAATRYARAVSLQQMDMKNHDSHKEVLDMSVASGNMAYLAKGPPPPPPVVTIEDPVIKDEVKELEEKVEEELEKTDLAPEIEPKKLIEEVEPLIAKGEELDAEVLAKDVEKIDPVLEELPHKEVVKALEVVVEVTKDESEELKEAAEVAQMKLEPIPTFEPIVKAEIVEMEAKATEQLEELKILPPEIKPMKLATEISELNLKGEKLDVEILAKDVEHIDPALEKLPHAEVVEAVQVVVNVIDEAQDEIKKAKELAEGCDDQPRFNILMCESHMCTDCVLEYCMEKCQKIQKMMPTCRCADWPKSRTSFSTGSFAGKGAYGDAGDYAKPGSGRFL